MSFTMILIAEAVRIIMKMTFMLWLLGGFCSKLAFGGEHIGNIQQLKYFSLLQTINNWFNHHHRCIVVNIAKGDDEYNYEI